MLASGRPIVAAALPNTDLAHEISGCGVIVLPEDAGAMAEAVRSLVRSPEVRLQMGAAARLRALERWEKNAILCKFEEELVSLVSGGVLQRRGPLPSEAV
jgi:colanic acid biosynthesis glycosyl transferase WcaI